jgi:hypothetical protein
MRRTIKNAVVLLAALALFATAIADYTPGSALAFVEPETSVDGAFGTTTSCSRASGGKASIPTGT